MKLSFGIEEGDLIFINDTPYDVDEIDGEEVVLLNQKKMGYRSLYKSELESMLTVSGEWRIVKADYRSNSG